MNSFTGGLAVTLCGALACTPVSGGGGGDGDGGGDGGGAVADGRVHDSGSGCEPDCGTPDLGAGGDPDGALVPDVGVDVDQGGPAPDGAAPDPDGAVLDPDGAVLDPDGAPPCDLNPEGECCDDGIDNDGDGMVDEGCGGGGDFCGIPGFGDCGDLEWCDFGGGCEPGHGLAGICQPRPDGCDDIFAPVCGCDGADYENACSAHASGTAVDHDGECVDDPGDDICGTRGAPPCAGHEFCDFPPAAMCGAADRPGVCRPRPEACAQIFAPVCGCDGMDYGNACGAHAAGTDDAHDGMCNGRGGDADGG